MKHQCHRLVVKVTGDAIEVVTYRRVPRGRLARVGSLVTTREDFKAAMASDEGCSKLGLQPV